MADDKPPYLVAQVVPTQFNDAYDENSFPMMSMHVPKIDKFKENWHISCPDMPEEFGLKFVVGTPNSITARTEEAEDERNEDPYGMTWEDAEDGMLELIFALYDAPAKKKWGECVLLSLTELCEFEHVNWGNQYFVNTTFKEGTYFVSVRNGMLIPTRHEYDPSHHLLTYLVHGKAVKPPAKSSNSGKAKVTSSKGAVAPDADLVRELAGKGLHVHESKMEKMPQFKKEQITANALKGKLNRAKSALLETATTNDGEQHKHALQCAKYMLARVMCRDVAFTKEELTANAIFSMAQNVLDAVAKAEPGFKDSLLAKNFELWLKNYGVTATQGKHKRQRDEGGDDDPPPNLKKPLEDAGELLLQRLAAAAASVPKPNAERNSVAENDAGPRVIQQSVDLSKIEAMFNELKTSIDKLAEEQKKLSSNLSSNSSSSSVALEAEVMHTLMAQFVTDKAKANLFWYNLRIKGIPLDRRMKIFENLYMLDDDVVKELIEKETPA